MGEEERKDERAAACSHWGLTVSSETRARELFEKLFRMPVVKQFDVTESLSRSLFDIGGEARAIVFDAGGTVIEVFIDPESARRANRYDHLCLAVEGRDALLKRAEEMGLKINRFRKGDREIVFIRDFDGNLYEIKEGKL